MIWHPRQANNFAPLQTNILLTFFGLGQRWGTYFNAHTQTVDKFWRNFSRLET